jgi:hypothetical protein
MKLTDWLFHNNRSDPILQPEYRSGIVPAGYGIHSDPIKYNIYPGLSESTSFCTTQIFQRQIPLMPDIVTCKYCGQPFALWKDKRDREHHECGFCGGAPR